MKLPIRTFATVLGGMVLGWAIDQILMRAAVSSVLQLATPVFEPIHLDDLLGIGICFAVAFFIKNSLIRRLFIIAGATITFMEISEYMGVNWPVWPAVT